MLEDLGIDSECADDGQQALDLLQQPSALTWDLVFMDCQMPVMDGFSATRLIREGKAGAENRQIPIIACTANALAGDDKRCLAAGMDDYIAKPVEEEEVVRRLKRWLPDLSISESWE
jgi:CheY-like chemotaxis protein